MENVDLRVSCEIALPEENAECGMHEDVDEHDHVEPLRPVEQTRLEREKLAISEVRGSPEESYRKLYCYLYMLQLVNPGTITSVKLDAKYKFKYLFVALGASIEGFRAMRKVIVVDATFLKSVYGGMLVFATAQDPNHHHYPITMGVIDSEKDASWKWFFEILKTVIPDDKELVFMSDRHKSIIGAVKEVYPQSQHGYCIWHLSQNVRGKAGIGCKDLCAVKFRECAHKYTESEFLCAYTDFRIWFPKTAEYLDEHVAVDKWARCFFKGDKYNLDTSNACESMNDVFKKARKYALLPLIDAYVEKISEWFNKHRKDTAYASDSKTLVPYVENQLHSLCAIGTRLFVTELNATHQEYSVIGDDGKSYLVDLLSKCCSCRRFDIDKIPCVHAIAADIAMMRSAERRREIHLHELDSKSEATRGRKMYTWPDWTFERPCPNHNYIWKWWEDAVTEELSTLKIRVDNATSGMKSLHNMGVVRNCLPETSSFDTHQSEIRQLRELLSGMEREIGRMKELIAN
ncbi:protein FAR1-RELATED SEQUENCE 4-like [Eutrema salsugineum]|uniref:protein FAR1-RELATED SEQUENCE 4-like n=1 Tax=Eutrema salsugineum TaxID=72664 RepID=UPI000CECF20A|nr:protein FAR1-RELATED SEQUENCE 4-like [Eutrema salsugineum]